MNAPEWKLEFYEEDGREPVLDFLRGLEEIKEQALAAALSNATVSSCVSSVTPTARRSSFCWPAEQNRLAKQARPAGGVRKRRGKRRP